MTLCFATSVPFLLTNRSTTFLSARHVPCHVPKPPSSRPVFMSVNSPPTSDTVIDGPFQGAYGTWYLTQADADDVTRYRQALSVMCASIVTATILSITSSPPPIAYDVLLLISTAAFGVALQKIHIYAKPIHDALKVLWAMGTVGTLAMLVAPFTDHSAVVHAFNHPVFLLAIGWQFVAMTGLFIKEAFCFGRAEALALILLTPVITGSHFLQLLPQPIEQQAAIAYSVFFAVFSFRKFLQPEADDIGDMSVFQHLAKGGTL